MLKLERVDKYYNAGTVNEMQLFDKFGIEVPEGQFLCIVGSNGSGKTSLLNIVCGSVPIDAGRIELAGEDITNKKEHLRYQTIGRVFQDPAAGTVPDMTILENMAIADNKGRMYGLGRGTDKSRIDFYRSELEQIGLGLENKMDQLVGSLSGGQRQAIALIMSTMTPLNMLILDEHTAALDPRTAQKTMDLTEKIVRETGLTTMMVTHNLRFAIEFGDRLVMMHEGKIILDAADEAKAALDVDDVLDTFNKISIEYGN